MPTKLAFLSSSVTSSKTKRRTRTVSCPQPLQVCPLHAWVSVTACLHACLTVSLSCSCRCLSLDFLAVSVYVFVSLSLYVFFFLSLSLSGSVCLPFPSFVSFRLLFICRSPSLSVSVFCLCLSACLSLSLPLCLPTCLSVYLSVYLSPYHPLFLCPV